jgi:cytochrome c553
MNKIILSTVLAFFLVACSDSDVQEKKELVQAEASEVREAVAPTLSQEAPPSETLDTAAPAESQEAKKLANKEVSEAKEAAQEVVVPAVEEVPKEMATVTTQSDGEKLFSKCAGCHGMHGQKHALGKSQVIQGWDATKVQQALQGYKDGTYGGASKSFMKTQVANLSDADIKALSEYISKL